jgi:hypothetical protein
VHTQVHLMLLPSIQMHCCCVHWCH